MIGRVGEPCVIVGDTDALYAIPVTVLDAHRAAPDEREAVAAHLRELGDTRGHARAVAAGAELPAAVTVCVLPPEELERYRLTDQERDAHLAGRLPVTGDEGDAHGFAQEQFIGRFVSETLVVVGPTTMRMSPRDAAATYRVLGYYPPLR